MEAKRVTNGGFFTAELHRQQGHGLRGANDAIARIVRNNDSRLEAVVGPIHIDHEAASANQPFDRSRSPSIRQCRQQVQLLILTLQQQFDDTCRTGKISVNLKRGMTVEQIGVGATAITVVAYALL